MSDKTALGDRMKAYEAVTRQVLPRRTYTIIRVDGRSFHSYLRDAIKPYDWDVMNCMDEVGIALCREISGAQFAFVQSDEISILVTDFASQGTQPWFGGVVPKMVSISAALASVTMTQMQPERPPALFDSRVFTIPGAVEVAEYFVWRQRDCVKNSISMAAQSFFSHRELHRLNSDQMQEKLWSERGVNWSEYPDGAKRGRVIVKEGGDKPITYKHKVTGEQHETTAYRTWWEAKAAPHFTMADDNPLNQMVPTPARYPW